MKNLSRSLVFACVFACFALMASPTAARPTLHGVQHKAKWGTTGFPGATTSYYVQTADTTTARNEGCAQATAFVTNGYVANPVVLLDFGQPAHGGGQGEYGAYMVFTHNTYIDDGGILIAAENYVMGFISCEGNNAFPLTLVVGLNNHGRALSTEHATTWASMVGVLNSNIVNNYHAPYIAAVAGMDIEPDYNSYKRTAVWVNAYTGSPATNEFVDYGNATGKHPWPQSQILAVSACASCVAFPEIYSTGGGNAMQWYALNQLRPIHFLGALTQYGACQVKPKGCDGADNTPQEAWEQMVDLFGNSFPAGSDITYKT